MEFNLTKYGILTNSCLVYLQAESMDQFDTLHELSTRIYKTWIEVADDRLSKFPQKIMQRDVRFHFCSYTTISMIGRRDGRVNGIDKRA